MHIIFIFFIANLFAHSSLADSAAPRYLGAITCASSACHGNPSPLGGTSISRNEFTLWSKHDAHSQAFKSLSLPDGKRIASHLGLEDPEKSTECLICHSTVTNAQATGLNFRVDEGITCERCHGAAEFYIKSHTKKSVTHRQNLATGLKDIQSPLIRAELCLDCHQGNLQNNATHRLYGAGHPRLTFELSTFTEIQPRHFVADQDYEVRKGKPNRAEAWLIGQIAMARRTILLVNSPKHSRSGSGWTEGPELSLMYCSSCHHDLETQQFKSFNYVGKPGELRLNFSHLKLAGIGLALFDRAKSNEILAAVERLESEPTEDKLKRVDTLLKESVSSISKQTVTDTAIRRTIKMLLTLTDKKKASPPYELAEQIAMAVSSLSSELGSESKAHKPFIEKIFKSLDEERLYDPLRFAKACDALNREIPN